mmetsp:Transcript_2362/g.5086  ORF Transcript_2362/g.5086 Transcript_2362/m.5086 type:complete len:216 (+) Transcript_2362:800-1447(+)
MDANNSHSRIYFQVVFMIYNDVEYKHSLVVARLKSYIRLDYSTGTKKKPIPLYFRSSLHVTFCSPTRRCPPVKRFFSSILITSPEYSCKARSILSHNLLSAAAISGSTDSVSRDGKGSKGTVSVSSFLPLSIFGLPSSRVSSTIGSPVPKLPTAPMMAPSTFIEEVSSSGKLSVIGDEDLESCGLSSVSSEEASLISAISLLSKSDAVVIVVVPA